MNVTKEDRMLLQPSAADDDYFVIGDGDYIHTTYDVIPGSQDNTIHDSFLSQVDNTSAFFGIFLSVWVTVLNISAVCLCLRKKQFRSDTYYLQIVNFCLSNLISGVFVIPFTVYYVLHPWTIGDGICKVWVIFDVFLPFVSTIILLILNMDRLLLLTHATGYMCLFQTCLKQIVLALPWLIALVIVVPLWTYGTMPYQTGPGECFVIPTTDAALASPIVTYFLPLIALIVLTLKILIHRIKSQTLVNANTVNKHYSLQYAICETSVTACDVNQSSSTRTNEDRPTRRRVRYATADSIIALSLVNLFFAAMWFPFQCMSFMLAVCTSSLCVPSGMFTQTVTWMGAASAGVAPLFWLVDKHIRQTATRCGRSQSTRCDRSQSEAVGIESTEVNVETSV